MRYIIIGDKMRKKIWGLLSPLVIAILVGYACGKLVYKTYNKNMDDTLKSSKIYLLENGNYDTYEEMREANNQNNYVYYIDDEKYKTVVGITQESSNIDKIKKIYNDDLLVDEYYIPVENIDVKQVEYDKKLNVTDSEHEIKNVVDEILELYKKNEDVRLISIK